MKRQKPRRQLTIGRIVKWTLYAYFGMGMAFFICIMAADAWKVRTKMRAEELKSTAKLVYHAGLDYLEEDAAHVLVTCSGRVDDSGETGSFAALLSERMPYSDTPAPYYVLVCEDGIPLYALCSNELITDYRKTEWQELLQISRDPFHRRKAVASYP